MSKEPTSLQKIEVNTTNKYEIEYHKNSEISELLIEVDFTEQRYKGNEIVEDVVKQLKQLDTANLCQDIETIEIHGRMSLPLTYVFVHEFQHLVNVIAYSVPQLNDNFMVVYTSKLVEEKSPTLTDKITSRNPVFAVTIHNLSRKTDIAKSQGIHLLAEFLADMVFT